MMPGRRDVIPCDVTPDVGGSMKIILAGHNIDRSILLEHRQFFEQVYNYFNPGGHENIPGLTKDELLEMCRNFIHSDNLTPETISAAYARISRDPRPVNQLREESRTWVSRARRSNRRIVFDMGHASIAEHAVFNLDIIGISRLATELLQRHRLCSFTEKSQRYIHLGKDYFVPEEIAEIGLKEEFENFVTEQFKRYERISAVLKSKGLDVFRTGEDARYVLPLCVTTQMGLTANARTIEYILQHAASSDLPEYRSFGRRLFETIHNIAPSVVKYTQGTTALTDTPRALRQLLPAGLRKGFHHTAESVPVTLVHVTPDADDRVLVALMLEISGMSSVDCRNVVGKMSHREKKKYFIEILRNLKPWDPLPRAFEYAEITYELLLSAAAFGQLKRHRMATLTAGPYHPDLGITVPPGMKNTRAEQLLRQAADESRILYRKIRSRMPILADYVLLGAQRRRVLVRFNARELIHFSRLREDLHAQWDIRTLANSMVEHAREFMPLCLLAAAGKHEFAEKYDTILNEFNL